MKKKKLITRITCDLDTKSIDDLIRCLKVFRRYGFTKDLTVKPSATNKGFHIISWHKDKGFTLEKLLKIRKKAGDDHIRIMLDSKSNRVINVLFTSKTKQKSELKLEGIPIEVEVKGAEENVKISFWEV